MSEKITFGQQRQIRRGKIRVGWIEDMGSDKGTLRWRVRFTPASGISGEFHGRYRLLGEAKIAALIVLLGEDL